MKAFCKAYNIGIVYISSYLKGVGQTLPGILKFKYFTIRFARKKKRIRSSQEKLGLYFKVKTHPPPPPPFFIKKVLFPISIWRLILLSGDSCFQQPFEITSEGWSVDV